MIHDEHRKRMRARYLRNGFGSFADHELVEMVLYYCFPRGDTNELAHRMLDYFGSLRALCEASTEELMNVEGMTERVAFLFPLVMEMGRRHELSTFFPGERYDNLGKVGNFLYRQFLGADHEKLIMLLFSNRMTMLDCSVISEGTVNSTQVVTNLMTRKAVMKKASYIILAHNHPNGLAIPSADDLEETDQLYHYFNQLGIPLVEHLVFAQERFCPIVRRRYGTMRASPLTGKMGSDFFKQFYESDAEVYQADPVFCTRDELPSIDPCELIGNSPTI